MQTKPNNTWIWFFVILFVLTVAASGSLIWYNLQQQLTLDKLATAQGLWQQHGPRDYDMRYAKTISRAAAEDIFDVKVRGGEAVEVRLNGEPLEERLRHYHTMPAQFSYLKRFLEIDAAPGRPRTFTVASFDEKNGRLRSYIRNVPDSSERVAITVQTFEAVAP